MSYFASFLILLFSFLVAPCVNAAEPQSKPVVYNLSATKIAKYIEITKGQKRVILIYTSWCPYCRKKMPGLIALERKKARSIIAISVDQNSGQFAQYARRGLKNAPFRVILHKGREDVLVRKLSKLYKVKSWTGYPTLIFLDENNVVRGQGNYSVQQASQFLFN